ncbi:MAG: hypothetical protein K8I82_13185, partial [Anaerolineae bacterium]|nr:hypothetical protein [Anaerolineae bacterium]
MEIAEILITAVISLLIGYAVPGHWRIPVFFVLSIAALFWLQTLLPPFLTLLITAAVWWMVQKPEQKENWPQTGLLVGVGCVAGLLITGATPDGLRLVSVGILGVGTIISAAAFTRGDVDFQKQVVLVLIGCLIAILFILKTPALNDFFSLQWIGISYIAFRLIGMMLDFRNDRLPALGFQETLIYVIFPASLVAGPIDQAQRFITDLRAQHPFTAERLMDASTRLTMGLFKKFVVADSLA